MKRYLLYIFFAIFALSSCTEELLGYTDAEMMSVSVEDVTMGCNGETVTVEVESLCSWEISASEDWVHTSVENGISGKTSFTISADENKTVNKRTAIIAIANSNAAISRSITVHQGSDAPFITSDVDKVEFSADASTKSIKINSNIDYTITSSQSWCKINTSKGTSGELSLEVNVEANYKLESRSATIKIEGKGYNIAHNITIQQSASQPSIELSESAISISSEGGRVSLVVMSSISWTASCNTDWVTLSENSGTQGASTLNITIAANLTEVRRTAVITINNAEYDILTNITIVQGQGYVILYTSADGQIVTPYSSNVFGANIVSNTCKNGQGIIVFDVPITSIGDYAFYECSSLTSVTIGNSVTSIGDYAFEDCISLTSITIPNSVTSIGERAFYNCGSLTSVTIGNSVTSIGKYAFYGCSILTSITIPNSVTEIGYYAFYGCSSLTSITIPNSVTSIGEWTFGGCSSLTSITIPNSVTSIGGCAFYGCSSLTSVTIPNSITSIGDQAFRGCTGELIVNCNIPNASLATYSAFYNSKFTKVTIGEGVTSIGEHAFSYCSSLTSITIPNSVTKIGERAFNRCRSLTSITIPNSVTSIGGYAFYECSSLTSVYCKSTTPPTGGGNYMFYSNAYDRKIYVPTNSVNAYKAAQYWSSYASDIVGYDF